MHFRLFRCILCIVRPTAKQKGANSTRRVPYHTRAFRAFREMTFGVSSDAANDAPDSMRRAAFVGSPKGLWKPGAPRDKLCKRRTVVALAGGKFARGSTAAILVSVPVLWGSYGTLVKLLGDMPAVLVNAGDVCCAALFAALLANNRKTDTRARLAAAELSLYLFAGSNLQLQALQYLSASRVAFWVQLTSVIVPAGAALAGEKLPRFLPPAALLAALGAAIIARDSAAGPLGVGDVAGILSAVAYRYFLLPSSASASYCPANF